MAERRWWVFDRPLLRDPLFIAGLVLGVAGIARVVARHDHYGAGAFVLTVLFAVPWALVATGTVGGIVREYHRGRRTRGAVDDST